MTAVGLIRGLLVFILSKMVNSGRYWLPIIYNYFYFTSLSLFTLVKRSEQIFVRHYTKYRSDLGIELQDICLSVCLCQF